MGIIARAEGVFLEDTEGHRYLDGVSSLWCNVHGHQHPRLNAAIEAQLHQVAHTTLLGLTHPPAISLAARLVQLSQRIATPGLPRVFFSDSGSTATEVALKMAFQAQQQRGETQRVRFAALTEAYHGDTLGAVSVGGISLFHGIYRPLLFDAIRVPAPERIDAHEEAACLEAAAQIFRTQGHEIAALIVEPLVQGAAGMRMHSPQFLKALCEMARTAGIFLIADEVATGFGRTGTLFAMEQVGILPDLLCLAKGLTGGYLPLAATLASNTIYEAFRGDYTAHKTLFHGHTFTGNPLACAAALASLDVFEEERVLENLPPKIAALKSTLDLDHPWVLERRQYGMMAALVLAQPDKTPFDPGLRVGMRVCYAARKEGVLLRNLGDAVVLMPPLAMTAEQLGSIKTMLQKAISCVEKDIKKSP